MSGMQITPEVKDGAADVSMESYVYLEEGADTSAYTVELSILDHAGQLVLKEKVALSDFTFDQARFGAITDENSLKGKGVPQTLWQMSEWIFPIQQERLHLMYSTWISRICGTAWLTRIYISLRQACFFMGKP